MWAPMAEPEPVWLMDKKRPEHFSLGSPDFATPPLATGTDFPEFIAIMLTAVWHFKIDAKANRYPKHGELVAHFMKCQLFGRQADQPPSGQHPSDVLSAGERDEGRKLESEG